MPVKLALGDFNGFVEILIGQGRIENFVSVLDEIGRLDAAGNRLPAVKEEDSHVG